MSESLIQPNETYYSERQKFRQWWIWILILIGPLIYLWIIFQQIVMNSQIGDNSANYLLFIPGFIFGIGLPLFIYSMGLDTEVTDCGVRIRFRPFHRKWVVLEFNNIQKAEAHTYSPIKDYGGWGIRYGTKGKAYNVSSNKGLFLTMKHSFWTSYCFEDYFED